MPRSLIASGHEGVERLEALPVGGHLRHQEPLVLACTNIPRVAAVTENGGGQERQTSDSLHRQHQERVEGERLARLSRKIIRTSQKCDNIAVGSEYSESQALMGA